MIVTVNGRYSTQRMTGVQRYAAEIVSRLSGRVSVVSPQHAMGSVRGHAWEQFYLPASLQGSLLWSPCNTGPLRYRRQVVTMHDCAFHDCPEAFSKSFRLWYEWLLPRLARRVAKVITVSEFSRNRIVDLLDIPLEKVAVVPNAVSPSFRRTDNMAIAAMRARLELPNRYVLSLGSIEPRKNLNRLLQAWKLVSKRLSGHVLVVAGGRSTVFREAFSSVPENVLFPGYVDDGDLPALYSGASCFVYPSIYEGFGLPVLEAMACGTPVVCSNSTSIPEVSGDSALSVDPFDVEAIGRAMTEILLNRELQKSLSVKVVHQASQFSWDRASDQIWDILQSQATDRQVASMAFDEVSSVPSPGMNRRFH